MMLNEITKLAGKHKKRKRVGRGESSGVGKTCGRGHKGCQSRSGGGARPVHEGGQMPIFRRLPKRGFSNVQFATRFETVNIKQIEARFNDGDKVDLAALAEARLIDGPNSLVKILGDGKLTKKMSVVAHAFSAKARGIIEQAGGEAELITRPDPADQAKAKRNTNERTLKVKAKAKAEVAKPAPAAEQPVADKPAEPAPAEKATPAEQPADEKPKDSAEPPAGEEPKVGGDADESKSES